MKSRRRVDIKKILKDPDLRQQIIDGVRRFLWKLEINPDESELIGDIIVQEKIEKMKKARENNGPEGPEKLLFMWVKQGRVSLREFKELIPYLNKDSDNGI